MHTYVYLTKRLFLSLSLSPSLFLPLSLPLSLSLPPSLSPPLSVVIGLAEQKPAKPRYLLAVDESKNTLKEIISAISSELTTGRVSSITQEEALLIEEISVSQSTCTCSYM